MRRRLDLVVPLASLVLSGVILASCGGGGGGATVPPSQPLPIASASPTPAPIPMATTVPLSQAGGPVQLTSAGGISGTLSIPSNNAPAGATMTVTELAGAPQGGPLARLRRPLSAKTVLFSLELQLSQTITFNGLPGFTLTLPVSVATSGESFYIAAYQGTGSSATLLATDGPATVSGQTLAFAPTTTPVTLQSNVTYLFELYETSSATPSPSPSPSASPSPTPTPAATATATAPQADTLYVLGHGGASTPFTVNAYAPGAGGSAAPLSTFDATLDPNPLGFAVDATGRAYVVDQPGAGVMDILSFPYGTTGAATASTTLTGDNHAYQLSIAPSGDLATVNSTSLGDSADFYAPAASGNAAPVTQIIGLNTELAQPIGVAFDGSGNVYVLNYGIAGGTSPGSVCIFSQGSGNATPLEVLGGSATGLDNPGSLAVDSSGRIYVGNQGNNTITVYAPQGPSWNANGNVAPIATLAGSTYGFNMAQGPNQLATDSSGNLYVASGFSNNAVYVFAPITASTPTLKTTLTTTSPRALSIVP